MRRLWAYIITCLTALIMVGVSFSLIFVNVDSNLEYQSGKELTFQITSKNSDEDLPATGQDGLTPMENITQSMKSRLAIANITSYELKTVGNDTVKVAFADASGKDHYSLISNYLTFNGTLALTDSTDKVALMDEFRNSKKAYVTDVNNLPKIVVPVNKDNPEFQAVIESAHKQLEEKDPDAEENGEESTSVYVYLWYDFIEDVDSYAGSQEDETMAQKILIPFDISAYKKDEETGEYPDELSASISVDANGDQKASPDELKEAYYRAKYFVNLLNAGELDYKVTHLYSTSYAPKVESLLILGSVHEYVKFSSTLVITLAVLAIVALLLAYYFRIGALASITTIVVSIFGTLAFMILFGIEFNIPAFVGLVAVGVLSFASSIFYHEKVKEECYRGRSIKKANSEASKKSTLPIIDINVVAIALGVAIFLLGGTAMKSLSAALAFGGIISLVLNTLVLKGLMWMATNTTKLNKKYDYFGVDSNKVPDTTNEEKQTYFGSFADVDITKRKKIVGIISALLLVASFAGTITFGLLGKGNFFDTQGTKESASEIYFESVDDKYVFSSTKIKDMLANLLVYQENVEEEKLVSVGSLVNGEIFVPESRVEKMADAYGDVQEYTHYYYVASLNKVLKENTVVYLKDNGAASRAEINEFFINYVTTLGASEHASAVMKNVTVITPDSPGFAKITLATFVGLAIYGAYLLLRYRPSRGLGAFLLVGSVSAVTVGIFCLTRAVVPTYVLAMLPMVVILASIYAIYLLSREKELRLEDRSRDVSFEHKKELIVKADSYSYSYTALCAVIAFLVAVIYFGLLTTKALSPYFLFFLLGDALAFIMVPVLLPSIVLFFQKLFSKITVERKPKQKKQKPKVKRKSAEPEEAIFIGIND